MSTWTKKEMEGLRSNIEEIASGYLCAGKPTNRTCKFAGTSNSQIGFALKWYECDHCDKIYSLAEFSKTHDIE